MPCPICRRPVEADAPARPFCSERCRLLDLGNWLDGRYAVPVADDDSSSDVPESEEPDPGVTPPRRHQ